MLVSLIFTSGALAFLKGDMNSDDEIDNKDVVSLFRTLSSKEEEYESTPEKYFDFEMKGDGTQDTPYCIILPDDLEWYESGNA